MSITSEARANRAIREVRRALRGTVAAGLVISALVGGSGGIASAQSGAIVDDPMTDPGLPTSWREGRQPSPIGSEVGTFYADDGFHISIRQDLVAGTDIPVGTVAFTGGAYFASPRYTQFQAALQAGGAGANQSIEVDVTQVDGGPENSYGVGCRVGSDDRGTFGYFLEVGSDGWVGITKQAGSGSDGVAHIELARTNIAAASGHHLRVDCNGSRLTMFVDGVKVLEAQDSDYKSGRFGLSASTKEPSGIDVAFTNLTISRP